MSANTNPIYTRTPDVQIGGGVPLGSSANTAQDGTGANTYMVFEADATEGGFIQRLILKPIGTTAATVMRVFVCTNTGSFTAGTTNTDANTALIDEIGLPATTLSQTAATPKYEVALNLPLPAGHKILVTFGTSTGAGTTGFNVTGVGGKY